MYTHQLLFMDLAPPHSSGRSAGFALLSAPDRVEGEHAHPIVLGTTHGDLEVRAVAGRHGAEHIADHAPRHLPRSIQCVDPKPHPVRRGAGEVVDVPGDRRATASGGCLPLETEVVLGAL